MIGGSHLRSRMVAEQWAEWAAEPPSARRRKALKALTDEYRKEVRSRYVKETKSYEPEGESKELQADG